MNVSQLPPGPSSRAFHTVAEAESRGSPPPPPTWRPTGLAGKVQPQLRLPGWTAKERRLRAKLGGPSEEEEAAAAAGVVAAHAAAPSDSKGGTGCDSPLPSPGQLQGRVHPSPSAVQAGAARAAAAAAPLPRSVESPPRAPELRFVAARSSSQLFDLEGAPFLRRLTPLAAPALLASPGPLGARTPAIAVSRSPSRQLPQMGWTTPSEAVTAAGSPHARGSASGPLHFKFDSPPPGDHLSDGRASRGARDVARASRSRHILPSSGSPQRQAAASSESPTVLLSAPAPPHGAGSDAGSMGGSQHRMWSRGLAWLNDATSEAELAVPMPGSAAAAPSPASDHSRLRSVSRGSAVTPALQQPPAIVSRSVVSSTRAGPPGVLGRSSSTAAPLASPKVRPLGC